MSSVHDCEVECHIMIENMYLFDPIYYKNKSQVWKSIKQMMFPNRM